MGVVAFSREDYWNQVQSCEKKIFWISRIQLVDEPESAVCSIKVDSLVIIDYSTCKEMNEKKKHLLKDN